MPNFIKHTNSTRPASDAEVSIPNHRPVAKRPKVSIGQIDAILERLDELPADSQCREVVTTKLEKAIVDHQAEN